MRTRDFTTILSLVLGLIPSLASAQPLTNAFTYQGKLQIGGSAASGVYDFRFRCFDSLSGGLPVSLSYCKEDLTVVEGHFTTTLDMGPALFNGQQRFLEVEVRADTGLNCSNLSGFTVLSPRQAITATPYAMYSLSTGSLNGQPPSFYQNASNLTTGTLDIARLPLPLAINGSSASAVLRGTNTSASPAAAGVFGLSTAASGQTVGVFGESLSTLGIGVYGYSDSETGNTYGVLGENYSSTGNGVAGLAVSDSGVNNGVYGETHSPVGRGVFGFATSGTGTNSGVYGKTNATAGRGVFGQASAATGVTYGVYGETSSPTGYAGYFVGGQNYFEGRVGLGTTAPESSLHVHKGSAGSVTGYADAPLIVESNSHTFLNILAPGSSEQGILFGNPFGGAASGGIVYNAATTFNGLQFRTNGNLTRMVVNASGNVGIGMTSPEYRLDVSDSGTVAIRGRTTATSFFAAGVEGLSDSTDGAGVYGYAGATTGFARGGFFESQSTSGIGVFGLAGTSTGVNYGVFGRSFSPSGYDFYAGGAGIDYGSSSSRRWKRNVEPIPDPLAMLDQLRGVYFDWDADHGGHHDVGMIAEEVGAVLPEIVQFEENGIDAIGMDYAKVTPLLVESVKALRGENSDLRMQVADLLSRVESLERSARHRE